MAYDAAVLERKGEGAVMNAKYYPDYLSNLLATATSDQPRTTLT